MFLKATLIGSLLFILQNYIKPVCWEILHCRVLSVQLHNPLISGFSISILLRSGVILTNGNIFGFHIMRARFEIFAQILSTNGYSISPKVGFLEIKNTGLQGSESGPTAIIVDITLEKLGFLLLLRLLNTVWDYNGVIQVIIIGNTSIKSDMTQGTMDPLVIVAMKCVENIKIMSSYYEIAKLDSNQLGHCQISDLFSVTSSWSSLNASLPMIDRKYLYESL